MKHIAGMGGRGQHFRVGPVVAGGGQGLALEQGVGNRIARISGCEVVIDPLIVLRRRQRGRRRYGVSVLDHFGLGRYTSRRHERWNAESPSSESSDVVR